MQKYPRWVWNATGSVAVLPSYQHPPSRRYALKRSQSLPVSKDRRCPKANSHLHWPIGPSISINFHHVPSSVDTVDRVWWVTKVSKSNSGWFWILKIQAALDIVVNHAQAGEVHQCLCCCSYRWRLRAKVEEFGQLGEPADVVASCGPLRPRGGQKLGRWRERREKVWRNCCKEWGDTKWYKVEIMSLVVAKDAKRTRVNGRLGAFWRVIVSARSAWRWQ